MCHFVSVWRVTSWRKVSLRDRGVSLRVHSAQLRARAGANRKADGPTPDMSEPEGSESEGSELGPSDDSLPSDSEDVRSEPQRAGQPPPPPPPRLVPQRRTSGGPGLSTGSPFGVAFARAYQRSSLVSAARTAPQPIPWPSPAPGPVSSQPWAVRAAGTTAYTFKLESGRQVCAEAWNLWSCPSCFCTPRRAGGAVWHIIALQVSILGLFAVLCNTIQTRLAKAALRAKRGHRAPRGGSVCRIGRRCDRASTAAVCRVESRRFRDGCGGGGRRCEGEGEGKGEEMIDGEECSERADGSVDDGSNASAVQCQLSLTSRGAAETRLALLYCGPLCA